MIQTRKLPRSNQRKADTVTEPSSWDRFKDAIHKIAPPKKVKRGEKAKTAS